MFRKSCPIWKVYSLFKTGPFGHTVSFCPCIPLTLNLSVRFAFLKGNKYLSDKRFAVSFSILHVPFLSLSLSLFLSLFLLLSLFLSSFLFLSLYRPIDFFISLSLSLERNHQEKFNRSLLNYLRSNWKNFFYFSLPLSFYLSLLWMN